MASRGLPGQLAKLREFVERELGAHDEELFALRKKLIELRKCVDDHDAQLAQLREALRSNRVTKP